EAENNNIPVHAEGIKADKITIQPHSVTLLSWVSPDKYAPSATRIYKSRVAKEGVELSWWKRDIADGYLVSYGTDPEKPDHQIRLNNADECNTIVKGLSKGGSYYFTVKAINKEGESEKSQVLKRSMITPSKPAIFKVAKRDTTITIMWKSVANADGYMVYVNDGKKTKAYDAKNVFGYRIEGLKYNVNYNISVAGYNGLGTGAKSEFKTVSCKKHLPYPPRNISAKETASGHIVLEWITQDTINPGVKYRLYRGRKLHEFEVLAEGVEGSSYLDKTASASDNYYYTVKSYNTAGECNFYPNVATVIKRNKQINIDIQSISELAEAWEVKVKFSNVKLDGDVYYGVAVSDISYLNVEEDVYRTNDATRGEFTLQVPKDKLKRGRTYAIKAFVNTNGKSLYSLPPHKNIEFK
ncbi:MAG: fibronectin type III domain-containing protein, partial [Bacteroidales bacterium]|nr:fibronectin type III domain-containing protein [Bacteroidales bacterium]